MADQGPDWKIKDVHGHTAIVGSVDAGVGVSWPEHSSVHQNAMHYDLPLLRALIAELTRRAALLAGEAGEAGPHVVHERASSPAAWASVPREVRHCIAATIRSVFVETPDILAACSYLDGEPEVISEYRRRAECAEATARAIQDSACATGAPAPRSAEDERADGPLTAKDAAAMAARAYDRWAPGIDGIAGELLDKIGDWLDNAGLLETGPDGIWRLNAAGLEFAGLNVPAWSGPGWYAGRDAASRPVVVIPADAAALARIGAAVGVARWSGPHASLADAGKALDAEGGQ